MSCAMAVMTHDTRGTRAGVGLGFAVLSAAAFGLSGPLATALIDAGWTPGAAVLVRILGGFVMLAIPAAIAVRGRWRRFGRHAGFMAGYGITAVAVTQLCYFNAISYLPVGVALLIEFTAPVAVVLWMWMRHGQQPRLLTWVGGAIAIAGLVLLLDPGGGAISWPGVLWSLGAMVGAAGYFILSASDRDGVPPLALAAAGLLVGGAAIMIAGWLGVVPLAADVAPVELAGQVLPWWVPVVGLTLLTAALAYTSGIAAIRRLGSRLASFVGLTEVLMAVLFAWLLLAQLPQVVQLAGGLLILIGVVLVKAEEDARRARVAVAVG